jgi:hypothetical protein
VATVATVATTACAQWQTQTFDLKAGWNAVFLHVDASHTTLNALIASDASNPIIEVWRWNPSPTAQYSNVETPSSGSEWTSWLRTNTVNSLQRLVGDAAYLVSVSTNTPTYTWTLKGRPIAPRHSWTVTGLNLLGFPTVPVSPPNFETFIGLSPERPTGAPQIFQYPGGKLGPQNPQLIASASFRAVPVKRGQAFWIRWGDVFNQYFGPFEVALNGAAIQYGDTLSTASLRLRNLTTNSLTVTLSLAASEASPAGQPAVIAAPPLIVRTDFNATNLSYGYTNLPVGGTRSWTLAPFKSPGSEREVVIGLNRSAMGSAPGELLAGLLRFTDSLSFTRVDVGVSATRGSSAGLWVGSAVVNEVGQYLKSYSRDAANNLIVSSNGNYVVTNVDTSLGRVLRPYPLRLIVHNPNSGNAALLQRVFVGFNANTNMILSLRESALAPLFLEDARRLSAVHLPWSAENAAWAFNGSFPAQTNLTTSVTLGYDERASNPFLHGYHPDHDNLDATFRTLLPQGSESYGIQRQLSLTLTPPGNDFNSLVSANQMVNGIYSEVITLEGLARGGGSNDTRRLEVRGRFTLNRISEISLLTP